MVVGLILAAGESRRMGAPKLTLRYGGESLLALAARKALAVCPQVYGVVGAYRELYAPILTAAGVVVVDNPAWAEGLAASLRAGIAALPETATGALVLLPDQPLVAEAHLKRLVARFHEGYELVFSSYDGTEGAPAVIGRPLFGQVMALAGDAGARRLKGHAGTFASVPLAEAADIDTPEDAARLLR